MSADFIFSVLSPPRRAQIFLLKPDIVWGFGVVRGSWIHTQLIYFLFCGRVSAVASQIEFSYSWRMTQAKKFPKHLKSENWCLESMRLIVSRWGGRKKKEAEEQEKGGAGGWKAGEPELWLSACPGNQAASHVFPQVCHLMAYQARRNCRLCTTSWDQSLLGSKSSWNCLFWGSGDWLLEHNMKESPWPGYQEGHKHSRWIFSPSQKLQKTRCFKSWLLYTITRCRVTPGRPNSFLCMCLVSCPEAGREELKRQLALSKWRGKYSLAISGPGTASEGIPFWSDRPVSPGQTGQREKASLGKIDHTHLLANGKVV